MEFFNELFEILANPQFWVAVLRIATPLILGTLGVLLCERAGVLNLGIEGIMVAGAFAGWLAVYSGLPLWGGVDVAACVGAALGLLHAFLTVGLALSQHVAGLGLTMLSTAMSYYAYRVLFPKVNTPPTIEPFQDMPWIGLPILSAQTPLTLLALLLVPLIAYLIYRIPAGLALRMVGENPHAAESQGISVAATRTLAIVAGSALMGVAGLSLRWLRSTLFSSTWSTAGVGFAWRSWCLPAGGQVRLCLARCSLLSLMHCNCACNNRAQQACLISFI